MSKRVTAVPYHIQPLAVNHGDQTRVAAVRTSALSTTLLGHQFNKNSNTDFFKYFTVTKYKEYKS